MNKKEIKTLLKVHNLSLSILHLLTKFAGAKVVNAAKEKERWAKFREDYIKFVEEHDLTIEEEMFWACGVLNAGVHRIFELEAKYDPKMKKYGWQHSFGKKT